MKNDSLHLSTKRILFASLIVLLPILNQYNIGQLTSIDLLSLFIVGIYVCKGKSVLIKNRGLIIFICFGLITTVCNSLMLVEITIIAASFKIVRFLIYMIAFYLLFPKMLDFDNLYFVYKRVVLIATVVIIIQFLLSSITGNYCSMLLPLEIKYGDMSREDLISLRQYQIHAGIYRPASFFFEPAWYALFALPFVAMTFFKNMVNKRDDLILCIIVSLGLFVSGSTLGIITIMILWLFYIVQKLLMYHKAKYLLWVFGILALIGIAFLIPSVRDPILEKVSAKSLSSKSTFTLRILRGLMCFSQLDSSNKLFGVGYGNILLHFTQNNIMTIYDTQVSAYMNGMSTLLCYFGIVGLVLYFVTFIGSLLKRRETWVFVVCWILIMCTSDYYDNSFFFLMIVIMQTAMNYLEQKKVKINDISI